MIDLVNQEVKNIDNQKYKTIIVCVGLGCMTLIAMIDKMCDAGINYKGKIIIGGTH